MKFVEPFFAILASFLMTAVVVRAQSVDTIVPLPPFVVFSEMGKFVPIVEDTKDINSPIKKIWVKDVYRKSPAYKAGLRKGMFITRIQNMAVKGMTQKGLEVATEKLRVQGDYFEIFATKNYSSVVEIKFQIMLPKERRIPKTSVK